MSPAIQHLRPFSLCVGTGAAESPSDESLRERPLHVSATPASQDRRERESSGERERAERNPCQRHRRRRESYAINRDP